MSFTSPAVCFCTYTQVTALWKRHVAHARKLPSEFFGGAGYWSLASKTMYTARSWTSGENFGDFLILAPFSIEGASSKSAAVQSYSTVKSVRLQLWRGVAALDADGSGVARCKGSAV